MAGIYFFACFGADILKFQGGGRTYGGKIVKKLWVGFIVGRKVIRK